MRNIIKSARLNYAKDKIAYVLFYNGLINMIEAAVELAISGDNAELITQGQDLVRYIKNNININEIGVWNYNGNPWHPKYFNQICEIYALGTNLVYLKTSESDYYADYDKQIVINLINSAEDLEECWINLRKILLNLNREIMLNSDQYAHLSMAEFADLRFKDLSGLGSLSKLLITSNLDLFNELLDVYDYY